MILLKPAIPPPCHGRNEKLNIVGIVPITYNFYAGAAQRKLCAGFLPRGGDQGAGFPDSARRLSSRILIRS
jgi:hypothetical protein